MADKQDVALLYKKEIKFPASLGDWTTYKPAKQASKKIKPIFYSAHRISKSDLDRTLDIHNHFIIDFSSYLKTSLKASIDIHSITIEQLTYLDFLKRVTGGIINCKLQLKDYGEALFLVDYQLSNIVINFSLGCQTVETKIKELTELEESIIQSIFGNVLESYAKCWGNLFPKPTLEIISYPNIQRETHINLNEVITVITMQISVANSVPATLTFVYQNPTLKKMNAVLKKKEEQSPLNFLTIPEELLSSIEIPVVVELGSTNISTQDITEIENDDVIALDHKLQEPVSLIFGYAAQFKAQPGIKNDHLAIRVLSGTVTRVKAAPIVRSENETSIESPTLPAQEENFELPLEDEEKEEYNDSSENLFEEENDNPKPGGN